MKDTWIAKGLLGIFLLYNTYWDIKERKVLLWSVVAFGLLGFFYRFCSLSESVWTGICGMFFGGILLLFSYGTKEALGYGDSLAVLICGIYMGFWYAAAIFFYAVLFCSLVSVFLIFKKKRTYRSEIAFLPYMLAAYLILF